MINKLEVDFVLEQSVTCLHAGVPNILGRMVLSSAAFGIEAMFVRALSLEEALEEVNGHS